jgi:hypothetical protein
MCHDIDILLLMFPGATVRLQDVVVHDHPSDITAALAATDPATGAATAVSLVYSKGARPEQKHRRASRLPSALIKSHKVLLCSKKKRACRTHELQAAGPRELGRGRNVAHVWLRPFCAGA